MSQQKVKLRPNAPPRFHGAFTGGFSAGYFNTVGSEEGFKPKTFVSSRSNRAKNVGQKSIDYMDDDDDLLGNRLTSKEEYDLFDEKIINSNQLTNEFTRNSLIPGPMPMELVVHSSKSIGKQIMKKYGWKEGHAIGPRKLQQLLSVGPLPATSAISGSTVTASAVATTNAAEGESKNSAESVAVYVPVREEMKITLPPHRKNSNGIGYDASRKSMRNYSTEEDRSNSTKRNFKDILIPKRDDHQSPHTTRLEAHKRSRTIYADDDDDDHVYEDNFPSHLTDKHSSTVKPKSLIFADSDSDSETEQSASGLKSNDSAILTKIKHSVNDWVTGNQTAFITSERYPSDHKVVLEGFTLAKLTNSWRKQFPPIIIPSNYVAFYERQFAANSNNEKTQKRNRYNEQFNDNKSTSGINNDQSDSINRLHLLSQSHMTAAATTPATTVDFTRANKSVFEYLSEKSIKKLQAALLTTQKPADNTDNLSNENATLAPQTHSTNDHPAKLFTSTSPTLASKAMTTTERPYLTSENLLKTTFSGVSNAFKNRFVSASAPAAATATENTDASLVGLRSVQQHKTVNEKKTAGAVVAEAAFSSNNSGSSRSRQRSPRVKSLWFPTPLLCKRFNVPVPDHSLSMKTNPQLSNASYQPQTVLNSQLTKVSALDQLFSTIDTDKQSSQTAAAAARQQAQSNSSVTQRMNIFDDFQVNCSKPVNTSNDHVTTTVQLNDTANSVKTHLGGKQLSYETQINVEILNKGSPPTPTPTKIDAKATNSESMNGPEKVAYAGGYPSKTGIAQSTTQPTAQSLLKSIFDDTSDEESEDGSEADANVNSDADHEKKDDSNKIETLPLNSKVVSEALPSNKVAIQRALLQKYVSTDNSSGQNVASESTPASIATSAPAKIVFRKPVSKSSSISSFKQRATNKTVNLRDKYSIPKKEGEVDLLLVDGSDASGRSDDDDLGLKASAKLNKGVGAVSFDLPPAADIDDMKNSDNYLQTKVYEYTIHHKNQLAQRSFFEKNNAVVDEYPTESNKLDSIQQPTTLQQVNAQSQLHAAIKQQPDPTLKTPRDKWKKYKSGSGSSDNESDGERTSDDPSRGLSYDTSFNKTLNILQSSLLKDHDPHNQKKKHKHDHKKKHKRDKQKQDYFGKQLRLGSINSISHLK